MLKNMALKYLVWALLTGMFAFPVNAVAQQEGEEPCVEGPSKKARKLYEKGIDRRKYGKRERVHYLQEAIEEEPDFPDALFHLAMEEIKTAKYKGTSFRTAEEYLLEIEQMCPEYHSDVYYYLAEIFLGREDWGKTVEYQEKFLNFLSDDESKFARDYPDKVKEIESDLKYAVFYKEAYANPVPFDPDVVQKVSTESDEYLPLLTPDNEYLYFTRKSVVEREVRNTYIRSSTPEYTEEFTVAEREAEHLFTPGKPMPSPFNEAKNENYGGATISLDNKELFLTVCKMGSMGYKNCDIYASRYTYGFNERTEMEEWYWTDLQNLGENVNTEDGWESQPSLSGDGQTLYFASFRKDSKQIDIFEVKRDVNGNWGAAKPLKAPVNSEYHDKAPFIHSDSQTLYFASDRPMGFGGYDIYYTRLQDDGSWTEPKNIGYPINTEQDEHGFVVSTDGHRVFFGSGKVGEDDRKHAGLDIYSFELYKEARPEKVAFLKGTVKDKQGDPVKSGTVEIKNMKTKEVQEIKVDSLDGKYAAIVSLEEGDDFIVNLKGEDLAFESKLISFDDSTFDGAYRELAMKKEELEVGGSYQLEDIRYETNSAEIKQESKVMLREFADYLEKHPRIRLAIHGHTDDVGKPEANLALSTDRAYSVTAYLQSQGIEKSRLNFKGFGETKPIATNDTEEGRAQNRRTEFVILSK